MTDIRDLLGEGFPAVELYKEVTKAAHALKSRERPYFVDKADAALRELLTALRERDEEATNLLDAIFQTVDPEDGEAIVAEAFPTGAPQWALDWYAEHPTEEEAAARDHKEATDGS